MAGGRFELTIEPTAIGVVSLNSNSETHMTAICNARSIYGRGWISRVFICCATLKVIFFGGIRGALNRIAAPTHICLRKYPW